MPNRLEANLTLNLNLTLNPELNLNLDLEPDMKFLRRTLPFLCLMILGALGVEEAQAQPNPVDLKCVARSQRILGEYGECLSKVNSRGIRQNAEELFTEDESPLRGDAACIAKFQSRMNYFGELFDNRGGSEICECATGPEVQFFLGFFNYFLWGRTCEQFASHIVNGHLDFSDSFLTKTNTKAGCAARSKDPELTVEDLCGECGILGGGFGPDIFGEGPGGFLSIIGPGCSGG